MAYDICICINFSEHLLLLSLVKLGIKRDVRNTEVTFPYSKESVMQNRTYNLEKENNNPNLRKPGENAILEAQ